MQFPPSTGDPLPYLLLAVVASGALALGLLVMKGRAHALPIAEGRGLMRALGVWLRDPQWLGGLALQAIGYGLYVVAQAVIPVTIVSVMMQGGVGLFVLFAVVVIGEHARPAEWTGIAATIGGMLMMGLSLGAGAEQAPTDNMAMAVMSALLLAAGLAPYLAPSLHYSGIAAAIFSGVMFGLASLYTKGMTDYYFLARAPGALSRILANPYVYAMILTNIAGLVALQNSFAAIRGIIAMPLSTALSNIIPIAGASLAFGEHLPRAPWAAAMRMTAFGLTIAGGALLTNPGEQPPAAYSTGEVSHD
jgi:drug/metabolite transporter (DMT)-like permease